MNPPGPNSFIIILYSKVIKILTLFAVHFYSLFCTFVIKRFVCLFLYCVKVVMIDASCGPSLTFLMAL